MPKSAILFLLLLATQAAFADTSAPPHTYVTASPGGQQYFVMIPKWNEHISYDDGWGIAYEIQPDGSSKELWRTDGWYAFEVFLSMDGHYLVRMGPWNEGREPQPDDLAVAFYKEGKLLRKYSPAELVKDKSKIQASVSHYYWLARDDINKRLEGKIDAGDAPALGWDGIFRFKTIDGISYAFDITNGSIVRAPPTTRH